MLQQLITNRQAFIEKMSVRDKKVISLSLIAMIDTMATATARSTFYNTTEEQKESAQAIHGELMEIDRGLYGLTLLFPGANDYSKQLCIENLLSHPYQEGHLLRADEEGRLIGMLIEQLPPQRVLNTFLQMKKERVNNARTRKLMLSYILNSPKLTFWAVKYRRKIRRVLIHAWGKRKCSIIASILGKGQQVLSEKERAILDANIGRWLNGDASGRIYEAIGFILGNEQELKIPVLKAFADAKADLSAGKILPYEVLEGIRSIFHPAVPNAQVLALTKSNLTSNQKLAFQRKAGADKVKVDFDPSAYEAVRLYIYAFECGMTDAIRQTLQQKAAETAAGMTLSFGKIGILIDNSASMCGGDQQKYRPAAVALAMRDVLVHLSEHAIIAQSSTSRNHDATGLISFEGETSIAECLLELLEENPDSIFILSDGYENSPAGRTAEVLRLVRKVGIRTPVYQLNPVASAETKGLRQLGEDVQMMPVNRPEAFGLGMIRKLIETDVEKGIQLFLRETMSVLNEKMNRHVE